MDEWQALIAQYVAPYEPESPWGLGTDNILHPYTASFVGNGYIGIASDWLGLGVGDCQIADLYVRPPDPTDTVRARLPGLVQFDIHNGRYWLSGLERNTTLVRAYSQELDLRAATLTTRLRWHDGERDLDLETRLFACRHDPHLAIQRLTFTPQFSGTLQLEVAINERRGDLLVRERGGEITGEGAEFWLLAQPPQGEQNVVIAQTLAFEGGEAAYTIWEHNSGLTIQLEARAGQRYVLTRYVSVRATAPTNVQLLAEQLEHARASRTTGYDASYAAHAQQWEQLWQGAIEIEGDEFSQQVVRAAQYALLSSLRANSGWSISPQGLSSRGYGGHIFWDADTWVYPGMLLTHPELAQGIVEYRCDRLEGAQAKAKQYGYQGAMFPWEGDDLGVETTPDWAPCGRYEQHITACVALAVWQWWQATGDLQWLGTRGWPVLRECATFWASRVEPAPQPGNSDPELRYHIRDVQPADEYALHVDHSAWTNASAARTLQLAAQAAALLGEQAPAEWLHVAERLHIPFDDEQNIVLEFAGYSGQMIKQADVVLLTFPLEWPLPAAVIANNIRYYAAKVDEAHGPAMTYAIHAILAAQMGDQALLSDYLRRSYANNLRPPYLSFSETPDNDYCTFVTGAGGLLQALIFGCCGARLSDEGLTFPYPAMLPHGWQQLRVRLRSGGQYYNVTITPTGRNVEARDAKVATSDQ